MRKFLVIAALAALGAAPAHADDCSALMSAMTNQTAHSYSATVVMSDRSGHSQTTKIVYAGNMLYTQVDGQWHSMQLSAKEMADQIRDAAKTAKTTCHAAGSETVNGQPTTIYVAHVENQGSISDNKVWVSKANNVALKTEVQLKDGPHIATVFDYGKVTPPAGAIPAIPPQPPH